MAYSITNQCIQCDRCLSACPTGAVQKLNQLYNIDPLICNHCVGYYTVAQCWSVCPTNMGCISGITLSRLVPINSEEYWQQWFATYTALIARLHRTKNSNYWSNWFDRYAQTLSRLLQTKHQAVGTKA
ncbi:4Fe-4S binding protein [Thermocoleostomius sinensis]|jgi:ferredoxin|uniref:4Fe-4S binding protein n=1 Tax=Thermocoleostomius sinensis A174 TaxID=2016057 RepID=A0A9E8Z8T4_9CYAN|nr:4Fe-4S binding protein [Thermocoleostomius sinensis]WAL58417.1 4Fe-4S binding protein [Thermocoleostomius sinensis A174]